MIGIKRFWLLLSCLSFFSCGSVSNSDRSGSPFDRFEKPSSANEVEAVTSAEQPLRLSRDTEPNRLGQVFTSDTMGQALNKFQRCGDVRYTCVVDGDTLWLEGVKIRVADIDTPEISQPQCASEKALGEQATERFIQLLNEGPFMVAAISGSDEDRYGRKLKVLLRDGQSLGDQLVAEVLAHRWNGRRLSWC